MDSTDFVESSICNELQTCFEPKGFNVIRTRCKIHPSVILSMLDAHGRLKENEDFAIGTFLGYVTVDSTGVLVDVVDCFINPYQWDSHSSSLNIQKESHDWMLKLKEKLNPRLTVVGWYVHSITFFFSFDYIFSFLKRCCTTNIILYATALSDWVQSEQKANRIYVPKILNEPIHVLINPRFDKSLSILTQIKVLFL
jgi:translation initiation factor 3 subunit F